MTEGGGNNKRITYIHRSRRGKLHGHWQRRGGRRVVDLLKIRHEVVQIRRVQRHALMRADRACQRGSGTIMQIRRGGPDAAQSRHIEAGERAIEALAAGGLLDRADIAEDVQRAVGEGRAAVAGGAVLLTKHTLARDGRRGGRAVVVAVRTVRFAAQRSHVSRQRVEIGAHPGFGIAERLIARAGVELRVAHEAGATGKGADLALEVVKLIEVARPVQRALVAMTAQRDRVAQTFAHAGEIPGAAIMTAVVVTGGAGDVFLQCEPRIQGVIKELFTAKDGGAEFFGVDRVHDTKRDRRAAAALHQTADVMHAHSACHEVMHEQGASVR